MEELRVVVEEDSPAVDGAVLPGVVVVSPEAAREVDEVEAVDSPAEVLEEAHEADSVDEARENRISRFPAFPRWRLGAFWMGV